MPFPVLHPKFDVAGPNFSWVSNSRNPANAGDVLVDSLPLAAGDYEIIGSCAVATTLNVDWEVQGRNALNTVTTWIVPALSFTDVRQVSIARITMAVNTRIRIVTINGAASQVKSSLQWRRVG